MEFLQALTSSELPFLRYTLLTGILAGIAFGVMGTYVVVRRISYIAGAISHSILGGIGLALYLQHVVGLTWFYPMLGACLAAIVSALVIGFVSIYAQQREDTVIGAIWAVGMAVGLLFIAKTPGYLDPMSYLFGNILLIGKSDAWLVLGLDVVIVGTCYYYYNHFLCVCFDEEYSRIRGLNTQFYYLLLLCLTALTIVLLVRVVGIVMVIALLTLPAAVAGNLSRGLFQMMIYAILFSILFIVSGLWVSYSQNLPTGPVIILIAGLAYLAASIANRVKYRFQRNNSF